MNSIGFKKRIYTFFIMALVLVFFKTEVPADTFFLKEGSVIVGKVISKRKKIIIVRNSYGVFKIKKQYIRKMFITDDYNDDIAIQEKMGKKVDEEEIKKDYLAGVNAIKSEPEKTENEYSSSGKKLSSGWTGGRFMLSGVFLSVTGPLKAILPYGYGCLAAYDQGMDIGKRSFWVPGLRFEGGYLYYKNDTAMIKGSTWSCGPVWLVPLMNKKFGTFVISGTAGMSHLRYQKEPWQDNSDTLTTWGILGYEYSVGSVLFNVQGRYMYIFDRYKYIQNLGGSMGLGFRL